MLRPTTKLLLAGIASSLIAALPVWVEMVRRPELIGAPRIIAWNALFLVFLATFIARSREAMERRTTPPTPLCLALVLVQALSGLGMAWLELSTVDAVFLVIVAAQLGGLIALRPALAWVAFQTAVYGLFLLPGRDVATAVTVAGAFGGFQLFALYAFHIMQSERQAREELARTHESLLATRHLLAESTRAAERLRISRELHDALGHHLTALSLNLEAALHAPDGRRHVETAQRIARDLLAEVREVVGALRHEEAEGTLAGRLATTLGGLGAGVEGPLLHLTVQPGVRVDDPGLEHTLVRCAQEIYTNAVRHAGARNLWLEVAREGAGLTLRARDDGRGAARVELGNGLLGMRERVEEQGGRLDLAAAPEGGFAVTAWLPAGEGAA